ncbi:hypothetical protein PQX77_018390 [Marasmius sp. AFHP31]|nr:hypothetical protein PQX77_018390 [Marasmius sp. AFHP31]
MGGFAWYDSEGKFLFHLWDERFCRCDNLSQQRQKLEELAPRDADRYGSLLEYCVAEKLILTTEEEIKSLGHAKLPTKIIAIIQTLHFIAGCMARGVSGLAITELEFLTFGFAALNLVICLFWWHKPSGVRFPVRVMDRSKQLPAAKNKDEESAFRTGARATPTETPAPNPGILEAFLTRIRDDHYREWDVYPLRYQMVSILTVPLRVVGQTIEYSLGSDFSPEHGNLFSAGTVDTIDTVQGFLANALASSTAVILGVFHCIPIMLNYRHFPGHTKDHRLWTIFAIVITGLPLGPWIVQIVQAAGFKSKHPRINRYAERVFPFFSIPAILLYPIARIALIVLAVKQLIDLPPSALQKVSWADFIPHIGG